MRTKPPRVLTFSKERFEKCPAPMLCPVGEASRQEEAIRVRQAVAGLDDRFRTTIVAFYFDRLTVPEISARYAIDESDVRINLYRGHKALQQALG